MTSGRARIGPLELEWESIGPADGAPVLAITGVIDTLLHWHPGLCWRLADAGYRTVRYDARDCGRSTWLRDPANADNPPYLLSDLAEDAEALLDAIGISRAHVIGFSLGGCVAQLLAADHPARVRSLVVLMSTSRAPGLPPRHPDVERAGIARQASAKSHAEAHGRLMGNLALSDGSRYARTAEEKTIWADQLLTRGYNPEGVARYVRAMRESPDFLERLGAIKAPTTVIHAAEDKYFSREHGEDLAWRIPGARLEMIEGAGHAISASLVPRLADLLIAHLARAKEAA
jgi:pimeloyl-ACP methyl ester carboxylesterase